MRTLSEIYCCLNELAPLSLQMEFDNSGLQVGQLQAPVETVMLALDVTDAVVEEALSTRAQLIVSHHPLIFHPVKSITDTDPAGERLLTLVRNRISVISMHTNLDIAEGGVNDVLIRLLGAEPERALDADGCGRIGTLEEPVVLADFLSRCKARLQANGLRYYDAGRPVFRLAVMGGSGADAIETSAVLGCDTYVTADIKYHQFQRAAELGLNLIDADHFSTENPMIPVLREKLSARFPDLSVLVSRRHRPLIQFL